jgi:hypothetical protein
MGTHLYLRVDLKQYEECPRLISFGVGTHLYHMR